VSDREAGQNGKAEAALVGPKLLSMDFLEQATECLKVMAHPIRLRVVDVLTQGEFSVNELAGLCRLPAHQMTEHLRLLKGHGLLGSRRRGRQVFYTIASQRLPRLLECVKGSCQ
jgi:DNA-binding transcriptional ArsR family regulator